MTSLEWWYRGLMFLYPADYRLHREEEMIATLLATAGNDQMRPTAGEAVGLLRHAVVTRTAIGGQAERASGRAWAGLVAAGGISALVVLVVGVHLRGEWATTLSDWFVPVWACISAVPLAFVALTHSLPRLAAPFAAVAGAAAIAGPATMMAQRVLLCSILMFTVITCTTPDGVPRRSRVVAVVCGGAAGVAGVIRLNLRPHGIPSPPHLAVYLHHTMPVSMPVELAWLIGAAAVAVVGVFRHPRFAVTVGLLLVPVWLSTIVLCDRLGDRGFNRAPTAIVVAVVAAMSVGFGTLRSTPFRRNEGSVAPDPA